MSAAAHCAVIRNPFSTAVAHAKIPDGSVALSTTCRYSISDTIVDSNGSLNILLSAGFYSGLTAQFSTGTSTVVENQQTFGYAVPSRSVTKTGDVVAQGLGVPNQYRVVSQGLRLSLINNSQDNDGWFEAIRVSPSNSYTDWGFSSAGSQTVPNPIVIAPAINRYEGNGAANSNIFTESNWAMNPTYIAGKARDLHKHNFVLHRQENNDFIEIPQECTLLSVAATSESTILTVANGATIPFSRGNNISPWWVDKQMDSILIRIKSNVTGSNAGSIVFHAHMVQHVEECYDERSDLFRFMTKCPTNLSLYNATMAAMKSDVKPSFIRSPTMAVASPSYSSYKKKRVSKRIRR